MLDGQGAVAGPSLVPPRKVCPGQFAEMQNFPRHGLASGGTVASPHDGNLRCPCASRAGTVGQRLAQNLSSEAFPDSGCHVVMFSRTATSLIAGKFLYEKLN